jgi:hypothetical protein
MNTKIVLYAAVLSLLAPFLTSCMCTHWVDDRVSLPCPNKFNPSAVYRKDKPVSFALEGTMDKKGKSHRAFLIVSDDILARAHAQTNQTLSLEDIQKAYESLALGQDETQRKIPWHYVRVAVLPKNDLKIDVGTYQPGAGWGCLMPFALIVDLATFPFQIIYVAAGGDPGYRM